MKTNRVVNSYRDDLGRAIRELRRKAGLSQEQLAERADLHPTYIGSVERGEKNLTVSSLCRIARALGVNPSTILRNAERSAARNQNK